MLNRVTLGGRLTKDPELRYTPNGVAVCTFTLAVDRNYKNSQGERETDFIPHVAYRALAELCANSLSKGSLINTDGRLQVRSFSGQDGQKRWVTEVVAESIIFMQPRTQNGGQAQTQNQNQGQYSQPVQNYGGQGDFGGDFGSDQGFPDFGFGQEVDLTDDIPF